MSEPSATMPPEMNLHPYWARRLGWLCLFQLLAWTTLPMLLHPNVSLDVAEIVSWGHQWQTGYYKHPPLIAWIAETASWFSGSGRPWGIYLCGQGVIVLTFWAVWRFSRRLMPAEDSFLAALALAATFVCTVISLEFNHNTLLLPFFALTGWFAHAALTDGAWKWWLLVGCSIGLGMLSKYEMAFLAVPLAFFILIDARSRQWLKGPRPYVGLAISLLIFSPNFKWLIDHHFVSLTYAQSRMTGSPGLLGHLTSPLKFLGDQVLFLLPIFLIVGVWMGVPRLRPSPTPDERWNRRLLLVLGLGPVSLFLVMSLVTGNALRGAWGVPLVPFVPMMLLMFFQRREGAGKWARAMGIFLMGIMIVIGVMQPLLAGRVKGIKPLRVQFPGQELAARVQERWHNEMPGKPLTVVAGERWLANNVAFYAADRPAVLCDQGNNLDVVNLDERNCPWTSIAQVNRDGGVVVWNVAREGKELPKVLQDAFAQIQSSELLELRVKTSSEVAPIKVGLAIVRPSARLKDF